MHNTSNIFSGTITRPQDFLLVNISQSCSDIGEDESSLTIDNDKDQVTAFSPSSSTFCCEETLPNIITEPIPQVSSAFKCIAVPIDAVLLAMDESSASTICTPASEQHRADEQNHPSLDRKSRPKHAQGLVPDQENQSESSLSLLQFAHDNPMKNSSLCSSKVALSICVFKCPLCKREVPPEVLKTALNKT